MTALRKGQHAAQRGVARILSGDVAFVTQVEAGRLCHGRRVAEPSTTPSRCGEARERLLADMCSPSTRSFYDSKRADSPRAFISFTAFLSKETRVSAPSQLPS